jgi:hypothetical protein
LLNQSFVTRVFAAVPADVRKGYAFPRVAHLFLGAMPRIWGVATTESNNLAGKPEAFRTSGGIAVLGNNGNREALVLGEIKPGIGNDWGIPSHEQRENVGIDEDLRESHE